MVTALAIGTTGDAVAVHIGVYMEQGGALVKFDAATVSSSEKSNSYWVGSEVIVPAETKFLHLFADNDNSAPYRQAIRLDGNIVLCIPLVHGLYLAAMNSRARMQAGDSPF